MLEKITYINHINEKIEFGKGGIFANINNLRDYEWSVTSINNRISSFKKGVVSKTIPIIIKCNTEEEGIAIRNSLFETCEKDILTKQYGKLFVGDYYLKCFVTASKKSDYLKNNCYMKLTLTITTDLPSWVKETTTTFGYGQGTKGKNLDYNNDFTYDYTSNLLGDAVINSHFIDTNFKINIYGPCDNPSITIAGHEYGVDVNIENNEYLTIDSIEKTIVLTHTDGTKENCFNKRSRDSYVFEKIPPGVCGVSSGQFKFDITLLEERGEPKWT